MSLFSVMKSTSGCFAIPTPRLASSASSFDSGDERARAAADQPSSFQAALAGVHRNREDPNSIRDHQTRKPAKAKPKDKSSAEAGPSKSDDNPSDAEPPAPQPDVQSASPPSEDAKADSTPPKTTPNDDTPATTTAPNTTASIPAQPDLTTAAAMIPATAATPPASPPTSEPDGTQASVTNSRDSEIAARPQRLPDQPKAGEAANKIAPEAKSSATEGKSSASEDETPAAQSPARDAALDTAAKPAAHEKRPKPPVKAAALATPATFQSNGSSPTGGVAASDAASPPPDVAETKAAAIPATLNPSDANAPKSVPGDALTTLGTSLHLGTPNHFEAAEVAPAAQDSPGTSTPDPVDQVVVALKGKFDARTGKAEITLDPPNLGPVKVSVTLDSGVLTAEFHSDSDLVRNLLKGNLEKLKSVLQGQGVAVDRLTVVAPPASDSQAAPQSSQQHAFGSSTHDGRSAGQYQRDPRPGQRSQDAHAFDRFFRQAQDPPLDLVA